MMFKTNLPAAAALTATMTTILAAPVARADNIHAIRMSQVGFETQGPKTATIADTSRRPLPWRVVDASGREMAAGESVVFGADVASDQPVHTVIFSQVQTPGEGYRLIVDAHESRPFRIVDHPHRSLQYDALAYFYQNRAGTEISADHVARPDLARPAGHAQETATCFSGPDKTGAVWPGCDYSLDVHGGWYDAGDHGKYVVNGGIATWMLLNAYERTQAKGGPGAAAFADGKADIPEAGNSVDDLLDEARYEIEFLLRMQIPDGVTLAVPVGVQPAEGPLTLTLIDAGGMAHHKVHDARWTPLPTAPADDHETRFLYPPSTAATLNLAAVGAQCARIWRTIDVDFARRCASASQRAYRAALRNRQIFAWDRFEGGGGYGDKDVSDEFYWATAELYAATGAEAYLTALKTSPYYLGGPRSGASATGDPGWATVASLGSMTLALVPSALPDADRARVRVNLAAGARAYLEEGWGSGYGVPFGGADYPWGSNGAILSRAVVMGLAFDFTGEWEYRNGVVQALDYVLGRNPLDQSYVSGYGARPMRNPHHRFWAHGADPAYPAPPAGALSGGPNNRAMADEIAQALSGHCRAQTCWADDIGAYALNEVAINWNAPLVWTAAFLDDH